MKQNSVKEQERHATGTKEDSSTLQAGADCKDGTSEKSN